MTPAEMTDLLARAAAIDPRVQPTPERAVAWYAYFADYPAAQVLEALHEHYATSDRAVMPYNLLYLVKGKRERLIMLNRSVVDLLATSDEHRRALEREVADGASGTALMARHVRAADAVLQERQRDLRLALDSAGKAIE